MFKIDDVEFYLVDLKSRFDKIKSNTYYLSYSGGKDSHFLYWFIKDYLKRDDIKIIAINTYMEHHEILQRMYKYADIVLIPKIKPFEIKKKYGIPCFSKIQDDFIDRYQRGSRSESLMKRIEKRTFIGKDNKIHNSSFSLNNTARSKLLDGTLHKISPNCCKYLKKIPAKDFEKKTGLKAILGVRSSESNMRRSQYKSCFTKSGKFTPLYDLTDELLEKIYTKYKIEVPKVYQYIKRSGCMGCPYGSYYGETEKELSLINDNQRKFVYEYFKESYKILNINLYKQLTIDDFLN